MRCIPSAVPLVALTLPVALPVTPTGVVQSLVMPSPGASISALVLRPVASIVRATFSTCGPFGPFNHLTIQPFQPLFIRIKVAVYGDRCLLYTSDAADDLTRVDLGGRRIIKK